MNRLDVIFVRLAEGSVEGPIITRVTFRRDEPRGIAELRRLSTAFKEPEQQSYTTT